MKVINRSDSMNLDFVMSWLRGEKTKLEKIIDLVERTDAYYQPNITLALKNIEKEIKRIRKFIEVK